MSKSRLYLVIIILSGILFFIPFLGHVHLFDWDEINFAESAREMIVTGNYSRVQIDFKPFWEKPPLFFWMQAISMHAFGINEFAARFPNAIMGIITLVTFFFIGKKLRDARFGFIWALCYLGSFLPHLYFKSGIIDPTFNYFIFLTVYFLANSINNVDKKQALRYALYAGICIGIATLTKGPVGFVVVVLVLMIYWISNSFKSFTSIKNSIAFAVAFALISSLWFGLEVIKNGPSFIMEFVKYQADLFLHPVAGHEEPIYYHFVVVFLGCFPISILALPMLFGKNNAAFRENLNFNKWMQIMFWVVMILFTIVKTKIVHYSSLSYFPLSFLAAGFIHLLLQNKIELKRYILILLVIVGTIFSLLLIGVPLIAQHKELLLPHIKDKFAAACLQTNVKWNGYEYIIGIIYLIVISISFILLSRKKIMNAYLSLFYSTAFCMLFYLIAVVPKIENYSQEPAISFYKSLAGKDVYVTPIGFKSYAQYFYFQKNPSKNNSVDNEDWLLNQKIDKPAYFVSKVTNKNFFMNHKDCILIKQDGGFVFYTRNTTRN